MSRLSLSAVAIATGISLRDTGLKRLRIQEPSAVDEDRRPGDEVGVDEIEDRAGDIVRGADAAEQRLRGPSLLLARLYGDRPGCDSTDPYLRCERAGEDPGEHRLGGLRRA